MEIVHTYKLQELKRNAINNYLDHSMRSYNEVLGTLRPVTIDEANHEPKEHVCVNTAC